jgi:hypothetical protein
MHGGEVLSLAGQDLFVDLHGARGENVEVFLGPTLLEDLLSGPEVRGFQECLDLGLLLGFQAVEQR